MLLELTCPTTSSGTLHKFALYPLSVPLQFIKKFENNLDSKVSEEEATAHNTVAKEWILFLREKKILQIADLKRVGKKYSRFAVLIAEKAKKYQEQEENKDIYDKTVHSDISDLEEDNNNKQATKMADNDKLLQKFDEKLDEKLKQRDQDLLDKIQKMIGGEANKDSVESGRARSQTETSSTTEKESTVKDRSASMSNQESNLFSSSGMENVRHESIFERQLQEVGKLSHRRFRALHPWACELPWVSSLNSTPSDMKDIGINEMIQSINRFCGVYKDANQNTRVRLLNYFLSKPKLVRTTVNDNMLKTLVSTIDQSIDDSRPLSFSDVDHLWTNLQLDLNCRNYPAASSVGNYSFRGNNNSNQKFKSNKTCHDFNKASGCKRTVCGFLHKCNKCSSTEHGAANCDQQ